MCVPAPSPAPNTTRDPACASLGFFGFSTREMRPRQGPPPASLPPRPAAPIRVSPLSGGDVAGRPSRRWPPARTGPWVSGRLFAVISQFLRISASRNRGPSFGRGGACFGLGLVSGCWCPVSRFPTDLGGLFRVPPDRESRCDHQIPDRSFNLLSSFVKLFWSFISSRSGQSRITQ
jgi:hypothetical protein